MPILTSKKKQEPPKTKLVFSKKWDDCIAIEDLTMVTKDQALITEFGNMVFMFQGIVNYYRILLQRMDKEADELIQVLKREYEIEGEPIENKNISDKIVQNEKA